MLAGGESYPMYPVAGNQERDDGVPGQEGRTTCGGVVKQRPDSRDRVQVGLLWEVGYVAHRGRYRELGLEFQRLCGGEKLRWISPVGQQGDILGERSSSLRFGPVETAPRAEPGAPELFRPLA